MNILWFSADEQHVPTVEYVRPAASDLMQPQHLPEVEHFEENNVPVVNEVYTKVPITAPLTAAAGVKFLTVRRAPASGSIVALIEAYLVVNVAGVFYDPEAAGFSEVRLYQSTRPFVNFCLCL